jgi:hypothetical protein
MQHCAGVSRFVCVAFVLCLLAAGCGPGYPYYTIKGGQDARVVVIHLADDKTEEVPAGSGLGAGLTEEHKTMLSMGEPAVLEKGSAKVTMTAKSGLPVVQSVEYDGQNVPYHQPAF